MLVLLTISDKSGSYTSPNLVVSSGSEKSLLYSAATPKPFFAFLDNLSSV